MGRVAAASVSRCCLGAFALSCMGWGNAYAQAWNDARARALVDKATARRAEQLADTTLTDYQARAHGYVTFLAQLGRSALLPPKVVKTDELELEIKWHAPNLSKQTIIARRDTLLLPTDIEYHRDHLGIVQNNFPDVIRLGEGDEVRDVPHPLSPRGLQLYDFAITDSLRIRIPDREVDVYEVKVRPKNDRLPAVVGAVYIDRSDGQVVRMAFNFTHASFLDTSLEDLSVVLENRLVGTRYWLPSRQEIEIRRGLTWLDYPVEGIIRGRWEIGDYAFNVRIAVTQFTGPEIVSASIPALRAYPWTGSVMDSLPPDVRGPTEADIARVEAEARSLVRAQALAAPHPPLLAVRSVSDLVRFNRVEGLAIGGGVVQQIGPYVSTTVRGQYGLDIRDGFGSSTLQFQRVSGASLGITGFRDLREVGDEAERSTVANTIVAQEFGSDYSDLFLVRGGALRLSIPDRGGVQWDVTGAFERHDEELPHAHSVIGSDLRYIGVAPNAYWVESIGISRPPSTWLGGWTMQAEAGLRFFQTVGAQPVSLQQVRFNAHAAASREWGRQRLLLEAFGGAAEHVPTEEWIYLGGPRTAPGYAFHELVSEQAASGRGEWQTAIPAPSLPLGRFGRVPGRATLALYGGAAVLGTPPVAVGVPAPAPFQAAAPLCGLTCTRPGGSYPFAGAGLITPFDLLRIDVARGLNHGRWMFSLDLHREYWDIL